jgi:UPF0042 nucleotide-binding protein
MVKQASEGWDLPSLIIITGLSGSGMSSAMNAFEDLGYFCVDNLPLTMLSTFGRLMVGNAGGKAAIEKAVLVINIREGHFLAGLSGELKKLAQKRIVPYIVFFEASDDVLQRRFSETRRPHPADDGRGLLPSIRAERRAMTDVRRLADLKIDTSEHTVHTLRSFVIQRFSPNLDGRPLRVEIVSFGHKYGNPRSLDVLFDVRYLPNPYFQAELKNLPGDDPKVLAFFEGQPEAAESVARFGDLLKYLLPRYQREGRAYLTVGFGCTGGRHRSVMAANAVGALLTAEGFDVTVTHRDVKK